MLKLEKELPKVVERIEILKSKTDVIAYREKLKAKGNYKDFTGGSYRFCSGLVSWPGRDPCPAGHEGGAVHP